MRISNNSGEAIVIEDGETIHFHGEVDSRRGLVSRSKVVIIEGLRDMATA